MSVGPLLTVFGLLLGRATTVSTSDIFFLLGLGFHFVLLLARTTTATKRNTIYQDVLEIFFSCSHNRLMMEQSYACEGHSNTVLVAGHDDMVVANRATCLGNELYAALVGTLDVVAKGEESI